MFYLSSKQIIILKRTYFHQHWNTLEFSIVIIGIADIFCLYFVKLGSEHFVLIQITVVLGYLRMLRAIPLIKVKLHTFKYCLFFSPILLVKCLLKKKQTNNSLLGKK